LSRPAPGHALAGVTMLFHALSARGWAGTMQRRSRAPERRTNHMAAPEGCVLERRHRPATPHPAAASAERRIGSPCPTPVAEVGALGDFDGAQPPTYV